MTTKLTALEQERQTVYKTYKDNNKKGIYFLLIAIVIFVIGIATELYLICFLAAIPMVVASVFWSKATGAKSKFVKNFKYQVIKTLLEDLYENVIYAPNEFISLPRILDTRLVKRPDRHTGEDYISVTYKGVEVEVSEFDLKERRVRSDGKHTQVYYETYFRGRWMIFKFANQFKDSIRIIEKSFLGFSSAPSGFKKIETESIEFNKRFNVVTTDHQHALYIITPAMLEKLQQLERAFHGHISFLFRGNELHIAINDGKNTFEPKISQPLTDETLKKYRDDTDIMAMIINEFRLSTTKFMKK